MYGLLGDPPPAALWVLFPFYLSGFEHLQEAALGDLEDPSRLCQRVEVPDRHRPNSILKSIIRTAPSLWWPRRIRYKVRVGGYCLVERTPEKKGTIRVDVAGDLGPDRISHPGPHRAVPPGLRSCHPRGRGRRLQPRTTRRIPGMGASRRCGLLRRDPCCRGGIPHPLHPGGVVAPQDVSPAVRSSTHRRGLRRRGCHIGKCVLPTAWYQENAPCTQTMSAPRAPDR